MTFTTPELIRDYQRRTGLPRNQVLLLVARCGLVRYLSLNHFDRFVLKGGGLLFHVYGAPRVSFVDTDFADVEVAVPNPEEMRGLMTFQSPDGYSLSTSPQGGWTEKGDILKGNRLQFTLDDIAVPNPRDKRVNVSISFRRGERMITPKGHLFFDADGLLAGNNQFVVNGLVLEEVAAEKVLGWCTKDDLSKHFADLALLARDHSAEIDRDQVAELITKKFDIEVNALESRGRFAARGLQTPADLNKYFLDPQRIATLRAGWPAALQTTIVLRNTERVLKDSIQDFDTTLELVENYWGDTIANL